MSGDRRVQQGKSLAPWTAGLVLALIVAPQPASAAWRNFTTADGLANNLVYGIVEDDAEVMWFATDRGVSRWDGVTWRTYTTDQGLAADVVRCAFKDRDGDLWFGTTTGGATRFRGDSLQTFNSDNSGLLPGLVYSVTQDRAGRIWFAIYGGGAAWFDGENWGAVRLQDGLPSTLVVSILEDHLGNMWFGTSGHGVVMHGPFAWSLFLQGTRVRQIFEDHDHNLWFATNQGVSRRDSLGNWSTFTTADGLASDDVWSVFQDRAGYMWFATRYMGVSRFDGRSWRSFPVFAGVSVWSITQDRSGNLWFGQFGATRHDGVNLDDFPETRRAEVGLAWTGMQDRDGDLWFGTTEGGALRFDGSNWRRYTTADGLAGNVVISVFQDHTGDYWFQCSGAGVTRWDGDTTWTTYTTPALALDRVRFACEDRDHNIWVTGYGGVSRFDGSAWRSYGVADGLASVDVYCVIQDRAGFMWFTTADSGVSRFDGESAWTTFTTSDGLGNNNVFGVLQDRSDHLWFATRGGGATRFDGVSEWRTFDSSDGLPNDWIIELDEDDDGNLWFAMDVGGGVTRWDGTEWRSLNVSDGLPTGSVASVLEDRDHHMWFTTYDGIACYEPDRVPPRTVIHTRPPVVSASRKQDAVFAALGEADRLQYSHRLDGDGWSAWSDVSAWSADDLPDGQHTLEVRARDYWANVDPTPEVATFEVDATPPQPLIAAPGFGTPVRGVVDIRGDAKDARFASYRVRVRPVGAGSWDPPQATQLAQSTTPVDGATLAGWDTSAFPDGSYELRLSVSDSLGLTGAAQVTVVVDNAPPYFDETTPVLITTGSGGDIYTSDAELHLYVPPHAFEQDAVVTITPLAGAPPIAGAQPQGAAFELQWEGASLLKPATLEFSLAGANLSASGEFAAVYRSIDGTDWTRLGGTMEAGRVSLPIREPGRYALYADSGAESAGPALGDLSFTPRVFSPTGGFAKREVGIGFSLGRAGSATVRVYNRAGRLVREVVAGQSFGAGANLVRWDGRDREGAVVTDGLYIVTVEAAGQTKRRALAVVR